MIAVGRLFWKLFSFIWLAQLTAILGIAATVWLERQERPDHGQQVDHSPPAAFFVDAAATTLSTGGPTALAALLARHPHPRLFVVDETGRELLDRPVAPVLLAQARAFDGSGPEGPAVRTLAVGPHRYLLFAEQRPRGPEGGPPGSGPPPHPDRPPPGNPPFPLPLLPLAATLLASLAFAALLAWYLAKPIGLLRRAFARTAAGDLEVRIGAGMGRRRDQLADLGRDFDHMAEQLKILVDGQRRLLHDVSHEIRSPLARLQAAIGLARQRPDRMQASLERIEREGLRMDQLVGELLTLARLEAGVAPAVEPVEVADVLAASVDDARFEGAGKGVRVDQAGCPQVRLQANADLLHRAIDNVLRNALRHAPPDSVVQVEAGCAAGWLTIAILDAGPGVPEADLEAIFTPFFRVDGNWNDRGFGLGLALSRRVVASLGGSIDASNRPEGGLRVALRLPLPPEPGGQSE